MWHVVALFLLFLGDVRANLLKYFYFVMILLAPVDKSSGVFCLLFAFCFVGVGTKCVWADLSEAHRMESRSSIPFISHLLAVSSNE